MNKGKNNRKKRTIYTCKTCGNVSTMKKRVCSPEKISDIDMQVK